MLMLCLWECHWFSLDNLNPFPNVKMSKTDYIVKKTQWQNSPNKQNKPYLLQNDTLRLVKVWRNTWESTGRNTASHSKPGSTGGKHRRTVYIVVPTCRTVYIVVPTVVFFFLCADLLWKKKRKTKCLFENKNENLET